MTCSGVASFTIAAKAGITLMGPSVSMKIVKM